MGSLQVLLFVASTAIAQATPAPQQTVAPEAIAVAIQQLGARDFEVRQLATAFLWQAGRVTERALQRAAESPDPEVRIRAQSILEDFQYGIYADTPKDVAMLVRRYRRADSKNRDVLWTQILPQASIETLIAMTAEEPISARRRQVLDRIEREGDIEYAVQLAEQWRGDYPSTEDGSPFDDFIRRQLPYFLAKRQYEKCETLLAQAATDSRGIRNWAVYLLLRGQLDEKIESLQRRVAASLDDGNTAELNQSRTKLVHMLRLNGDEDRALAIARQLAATDDSLLRGLLFDRRAWTELAALQDEALATDPDDIEALGFAAAYARLSGNKPKFDQHVTSIRAYAAKRLGENSIEYCREALFLNALTDEAVQLLTRGEAADAFKVQILRNQYADAFAAAGIGTTRQSRDAWLRGVLQRSDGSKTWENNFRMAVQLAKVLATAGERHEAMEVFAQLASVIRDNRDGTQLRELAEAELQAKMITDAFEHAAQAFEKDRNAASISLLFAPRRTAAKIWWDIYGELEPTETTRQRLQRVRDLFYQGQQHDEAIAQISAAHARVEALDSKRPARATWLHAIGETYLMHQEIEQARHCFESIAQQHGPAAIQLADMLAKQEDWIAAAHWYDAAWQLDHQPYALYLHGEMLSKASADEASLAEAGKEAKQLARLIPLAGASRFEGLASPLARRGLNDVAQQEYELLRRCSTWSELQMFHAIASLSQAAASDDPLQAAAYSEQRMLNCLQETWHFTDEASYVRIPLEVHQTRAKGLLKQDKIDEAIAELRTCQKIWPGELNIPEAFVPRLDEAGQSEVADELFNRAYELIDEACMIFPNSALHHNNAAWLGARCNRRLDDALAHVKRALEMAPDQAQYIDTLGEVYFQQGKIDLAIDCAKQCIELEPKTAFYQQQLTRFQAAQSQPE